MLRLFTACTLFSLIPCLARSAEIGPVVPDTAPKVDQLFPLDEVHLLPGYVKDKQDQNFTYLLSLDPQRFLANFRLPAGLPATATPYGGDWESAKGFCRGHFTGHYLSACAEAYAVTGDARFKAKCDEMVAGMAECQTAFGGGYLFTVRQVFYDHFLHGTPMPKDEPHVTVPFYIMHKIMAGLLDAYRYTGNPLALKVASGMGDYVGKGLAACTPEQTDHIFDTSHFAPGNEFGGMSEVMHNLYAITGNQDYLKTAHIFDREWFLEPLANDKDDLSGLHANCHVPQVLGATRDYELTGKPEYKSVAENFWHLVIPGRTFNDGGSSGMYAPDRSKARFGEHWSPPEMLEQTMGEKMSETCVAHNLLRLTSRLFTWQPSAELSGYYERTFFNTVLGTIGDAPGRYLYSLPLLPGSKKAFGNAENGFWCCYGTGVEAFSQLAQPIYYHGKQDIWVNLYVASELNWKGENIGLTQSTHFPFENSTTLKLHLQKPTDLTLHLYIPAWTASPTLTGNGIASSVKLQPGTIADIAQTWHDGDALVLTLPMQLRIEQLAPQSKLRAVFYGPVMLAGLTDKPLPYIDEKQILAGFFQSPTDQKLTFQYTQDANTKLDFTPLFLINNSDTKYTAYFSPSTAPE